MGQEYWEQTLQLLRFALIGLICEATGKVPFDSYFYTDGFSPPKLITFYFEWRKDSVLKMPATIECDWECFVNKDIMDVLNEKAYPVIEMLRQYYGLR